MWIGLSSMISENIRGDEMVQHVITKKEAKEHGINLDSVDYCRQIRNLAALDRVELDESIHRDNKFNRHLFSYIEYCGLDPKDFIKVYLSNLQPYMISHFPSQEKKDTMTCVLDNVYRISLYIKVDREKGNEVIISFHENNKRGVAKENNTIVNTTAMQNEIVPVFGEPQGAKIIGNDKEEIKVFVQRGMLVLPISVMATPCEGNIFLVRRGDIELPIIDQCNQYLRDLYTSNVDLKALDDVEIFSVLQQISFTSYGNTIFSNLTLLIDNMEIQRGVTSKQAADFALTTYIDHLYLTTDQADELIGLLEEKYSVHSSRDYQIVLDRVKDQLLASAEATEQMIDSTASESDNRALIEEHNKDVVPSDDVKAMKNIARRKSGR